MASERGCHLFTILGVAGIGKSRLIMEFLKGGGSGALGSPAGGHDIG